MTGSVVTDRRGGRPRFYVVVDETTEDGGRRRRWHSDPSTGQGFTSKRRAQDHAATLTVEQITGTYVPPNAGTVAEWLGVWLVTARRRVKPSTWASYEKNVRLHVVPHLGALQLQRLTVADLDRLYARLLDGGRVGHTGIRDVGTGDRQAGLSPRTVAYIHIIIKAALRDAVRKGMLARNPAESADPPKPAVASASTAPATWTPEQLSTFLDDTAGHQLGPVWRFLAMTGCRRGEAVGLRWSDLDLDRGRASLVQSIGKIGGRVVVGTTKSGRGRPVALDPGLVAVLVAHREIQKKERELLGDGYDDHDLVFADPLGRPLYPERLLRVFQQHSRRLGLPVIRLHDLRHTWATLALQAGVHPKVVQERLGHASITITLQTYSHVTEVLHDDAAATVANLVAAARSGKVRSLPAKRSARSR